MPAAASNVPAKPPQKPIERKYKCTYCARAFSRESSLLPPQEERKLKERKGSEHRSRHERSHTKERPFACAKCRSTFVRRDLLLRHDRTVHAHGPPSERLVSENKRKGAKQATPKTTPSKPPMEMETATLEQIEASSEGIIDQETAAIFLNDLKDKATAAMVHQDDQFDETSTPFSDDHTTMFDSSVPYMPGAMPLAQPWDNFMSTTVIEPKAHSVSSPSISGSQDSQLSQLSYNSTSTIQPHPNQLPPMERYPSGGDGLVPGLQSLTNNMTYSGPATPNGLSPYPFMTGPVSPVDYRRSPGPSQAVTTPRVPQIQSDDEYNTMQENMKQWDKEGSTQDNFLKESRGDVNACLESYFKLFHHHLPFLHLESFDPSQVSPPLLLSILSIGALYSFNQQKAFSFHIGSKMLNAQYLNTKEEFSSRKCPIWSMQSTLLNMIFASWSGDPKGLEWTGSIKGLVSNMVSGSRYELQIRSETREGRQPTHTEWVEDEECRRTYYGVYIFFGLLTLTFDHTPILNVSEFDTLELPSSESLWNLEVVEEDSWRESLANSTIVTVREAHDSLFRGDPVRYSAFATRVMINALFLAVYNQQRSFEALQDVVTEYKLRMALETWEKSLELCEPETIVVQLSAPHKGHPLIFNAMAVFRNTKARLEVDLKHVQEALRYHDSYDVARKMTQAQNVVKRSDEMIKVIEECYNCIEIVALQGIRWVSSTCATNWSVEHPLCGLDLMVILSLWLYRLEHDEEPASEQELVMYNKVRNLFDDGSHDLQYTKLSVIVAQMWGDMLKEVVVWGITKIMGEAIELHSQALAGAENDFQSHSDNSTPTMASQPNNLDIEASFSAVHS